MNNDFEPFGYFRATAFGWEDCAETDEGAKALYERPDPRVAELEREAAEVTAARQYLKEQARQLARIAELERVQGVLVGALEDAATSLETIQLRSFGAESYLDSKPQMRAFAGARAGIARAALAAVRNGEQHADC